MLTAEHHIVTPSTVHYNFYWLQQQTRNSNWIY